MKIIFISGATGFIGQRLVRVIDSNVRVLSREKQPNYETVVCDLQSEVVPDNALDGANTVFHLAGFAHDLRDASKIADLYYKVNVSATVQFPLLAGVTDLLIRTLILWGVGSRLIIKQGALLNAFREY